MESTMQAQQLCIFLPWIELLFAHKKAMLLNGKERKQKLQTTQETLKMVSQALLVGEGSRKFVVLPCSWSNQAGVAVLGSIWEAQDPVAEMERFMQQLQQRA
eukprot:1160705-Pelagomonas_calceolata.AAC.24